MTTWSDEMPPLTEEELKKWNVQKIYEEDERNYKDKRLWSDKLPQSTKAEMEINRKKADQKGLAGTIFGNWKKSFFVASFNRASDGALSKLIESIPIVEPENADYIIVPGDRKETFEFALEWYGKKPLIHLWAGEVSQGTHDEIYRWAITNMSMMQLCTTGEAERRVMDFCNAIGKNWNAYVVGNVMIDNMPELGYDVVLYNPPTMLSREHIQDELDNIEDILRMTGMETYFWHPPNGDDGSDLVEPYVNARGLSRNHFLNLVRNCNRFISNSSCIDYEVLHLIDPDRIIRVGARNENRSSITEDLTITNATENILRILGTL